jgi:hypothetical protein
MNYYRACLWNPCASLGNSLEAYCFCLQRTPIIVSTCAILHNLCVDRWLIKRTSEREEYPNVPDHVYIDDTPSYLDETRRSVDSSLRNVIRQQIYDDAGILRTQGIILRSFIIYTRRRISVATSNN